MTAAQHLEVAMFDSGRHEYRDGNGKVYLSVTQVLKLAGHINHFGNATEEQANKGTSIHWVTALDDQGLLKHRRVPTKLRGYRDAWRAWKSASGFTVRDIEMPFISRFGYAGTIDRAGTLSFQDCVVDLKSGTAIPEWAKYQLVAYGMYRFGKPCRRVAVRLCEDGKYRAKEFPLETFASDWAYFYSLLRKVP